MPPASSSRTGMPLASPGRLSTKTIPTAPAACARAVLEVKVHVPRETSAIAPFNEPGGRLEPAPFTSDVEEIVAQGVDSLMTRVRQK